ncbi:hypothetical protein GF385_00495 [Candidatus Dependentiae bacterium]|nr:hypothetical protein [Candidatus Dependentiae bacterium]
MNFKLFFPWTAQVIFFLAILPQVFLNFKQKSTKGLSDFLLIGYFNAYIFYLFYVFSLNLPLAYRIMIPFSFAAVLILIFQRFYYSVFSDFNLKLFYFFNLLIILFFIPVAIKNNFIIGHIAGWLMMLAWAVYQIPQVIKNYKLRSVNGLSFAWLTILGLGDLIEFAVALFFKLPPQTYLNNLRGIIIYLVFCFQFLRFKN